MLARERITENAAFSSHHQYQYAILNSQDQIIFEWRRRASMLGASACLLVTLHELEDVLIYFQILSFVEVRQLSGWVSRSRVYICLCLSLSGVWRGEIFHQSDFNTYVWNDGNEIYYIHDVFQEGNFTRTSAESDDELKREPNLKVSEWRKKIVGLVVWDEDKFSALRVLLTMQVVSMRKNGSDNVGTSSSTIRVILDVIL